MKKQEGKNRVSEISIYKADATTSVSLPLVDGGISAGFPSPAQDYIDLSLDLNKELIDNPSSTFFGRVRGNSMIDAGIEDGDLLVIDKSLEPKDGDTAICFLDGEFTLKFVSIDKDEVYLVPANPEYKPIKVTAENNFCIWGVVTYSIKDHKHKKR
jgi:DNA polymerase V